MTSTILRDNVQYSFGRVRLDVEFLYDHLNAIRKEVTLLKRELGQLRAENKELKLMLDRPSTIVFQKSLPATKIIKAKKVFVGSKQSDKYHIIQCPYAKNIKAKLTFKSKAAARKKGYSACRCSR